MAMANMNLIGVFVTKLWPVQALACGGGGDGGTKNIIPIISNFGDIIITFLLGIFITKYTRPRVRLMPSCRSRLDMFVDE